MWFRDRTQEVTPNILWFSVWIQWSWRSFPTSTIPWFYFPQQMQYLSSWEQLKMLHALPWTILPPSCQDPKPTTHKATWLTPSLTSNQDLPQDSSARPYRLPQQGSHQTCGSICPARSLPTAAIAGLHVQRLVQILSNQIQQEASLTGTYKLYRGI